MQHPAHAARQAAATDRWVALIYHDVLPQTDAAGGGPARFDVPTAAFERMLDLIAAEGYLGCSLEQALTERGRPRVAITFDDGTRGQFEHAAPALRARGMSATFFITTDWVGREGFMSWDDLRQMRAWGMSLQSHTRSHPFLSELDEAALRDQLVGSREALDRELGQVTSQISFPGGDAPARRLRPLLLEAGYTLVAGSRWGVNSDDDARPTYQRPVRRCTVRGDTPLPLARRIIRGDAGLRLRRVPREAVLARMRSTLGPTRYARWRRSFLDALLGGKS